MNKKYGYIFLSLGILLLTLFALYNYTDLFSKINSTSNPNVSNIEDGYSYIKTRNINKKTRVIFPILAETISDQFNNEYAQFYTSDNFALNAIIYDYKGLIEDFENEENLKYYEIMNNRGYRVSSNEIECKYLCKNYKVYKDDELYLNELRIYIESSSRDVAELQYQKKNGEMKEERIKEILNDIKVDNNATYKIGIIDNNQLKLEFKLANGKHASITLDSKKYEEIESNINTNNITTIKDKETDFEINMTLGTYEDNITIKEAIDRYYNNIVGEEIKANDKTFYEYNVYGRKCYGYALDDTTFLLIDPKEGEIELSDFIDIK